MSVTLKETPSLTVMIPYIAPWQAMGLADVYLVGGVVRDVLMGMPVHDRDYVLVGAKEAQLLNAGFFRVGKSFPVFLHKDDPEKQEFAMARTERKNGLGHQGFLTSVENVSLEDDLQRRDLTINAMAVSAAGELVDPYHGMADLNAKILRHTSEAFSDDPLRVLRLARFAARYSDFTVAPETIELCKRISARGELNHISAERIWKELSRALMEAAPQRFIAVLRECGALASLLPEIAVLFGMPQTALYHPEICTGEHILLCLERSSALNASLAVRYAVLVHDVGKGLTPSDLLPKHHGHEHAGLPLVEAINDRFRAPRQIASLAKLVCREHLLAHQAETLSPKRLLALLDDMGGNHNNNRLPEFLLATQCDAQGRKGMSDSPYPAAAYLLGALAAYRTVEVRSLVVPGNPERTSEAVRLARLNALKHYITQQRSKKETCCD